MGVGPSFWTFLLWYRYTSGNEANSILICPELLTAPLVLLTVHSMRLVRLIAVLLGAGMLCFGCSRYPSHLTATDEVQAVVLEYFVSQLFKRPLDAKRGLLLFLADNDMKRADVRSYGDPKNDPSMDVLRYLSRRFPTTRPCSAIAKESNLSFSEKDTDRKGVLIWIDPFSLSQDDQLTVRASYIAASKNAEGYECRLQRENGRWKVVGFDRVWAW